MTSRYTPGVGAHPLRELDGLKIGFVNSESYFASFHTPSMSSTARATGADVVLLLAPGKSSADISDDELRALVAQMKGEVQ